MPSSLGSQIIWNQYSDNKGVNQSLEMTLASYNSLLYYLSSDADYVFFNVTDQLFFQQNQIKHVSLILIQTLTLCVGK
jgi:hypothetical protein